jgi:hypothetical protein
MKGTKEKGSGLRGCMQFFSSGVGGSIFFQQLIQNNPLFKFKKRNIYQDICAFKFFLLPWSPDLSQGFRRFFTRKTRALGAPIPTPMFCKKKHAKKAFEPFQYEEIK